MSFHLATFFHAAQAIGAVNADLQLVNDPILPQSSAGRALMPFSAKVRLALAAGVGMNRPRLVSPSLRALPYPQIRPAGVLVAPQSPSPICIYPEEFAPMVLKNEEFNVQTSNTDAAAQNHYAWVAIEDKFEPAPIGQCWTIRGTAAIVTAANGYASGVITLEDQLPQGKFALIGADVWGTNVNAFRFIFANGSLRPGGIGPAAVSTVLENITRLGRMGCWGYFENTTLPQLEIFSNGVTTTQEVFLDVVRVGNVTS